MTADAEAYSLTMDERLLWVTGNAASVAGEQSLNDALTAIILTAACVTWLHYMAISPRSNVHPASKSASSLTWTLSVHGGLREHYLFVPRNGKDGDGPPWGERCRARSTSLLARSKWSRSYRFETEFLMGWMPGTPRSTGMCGSGVDGPKAPHREALLCNPACLPASAGSWLLYAHFELVRQ